MILVRVDVNLFKGKHTGRRVLLYILLVRIEGKDLPDYNTHLSIYSYIVRAVCRSIWQLIFCGVLLSMLHCCDV